MVYNEINDTFVGGLEVIMCHTDTANIGMDYQMKENMGGQGDDNNNNNNFFTSYNSVRPFCPCMGGEKRIRRRHPATVQTPGRQMVEPAVMEPLVSNTDNRLDVGYRDCNDNGWGSSGDKFYEIQFVMDFSQMKATDPTSPTMDESATMRENRSKARLLSSKLK